MKTWLHLIRAEIRKLTSTRMPWAFVLVLVAIGVVTGIAVVWGTDMDGSKAFVSTAADQRSLMAFAANAFMGAGLFGAIAAAREYGHNTVVPTFLAAPRRHRAVLAQFAAVFIVGAVLSLVGAAFTIIAVAAALPTTEYGFLVSVGSLTAVLAASAFAGGAGAVLGAGIGDVVRNTGGAVTGTVLVLIIAPPLIIQLASGASSWVPSTLANVLTGVGHEVSRPAAIAALTAWPRSPPWQDSSRCSAATSSEIGRCYRRHGHRTLLRHAQDTIGQPGQVQSRISGWSSPVARVWARAATRRSIISWRTPEAVRPSAGTRSMTSMTRVEPVEVVEHDHVERRRHGPLLLEPADMQVDVVRPPVGQPVDQHRIAVEGEDHRPVDGEESVEVGVGQAVGMFAVGLETHQVDDVHHPDAKLGESP